MNFFITLGPGKFDGFFFVLTSLMTVFFCFYFAYKRSKNKKKRQTYQVPILSLLISDAKLDLDRVE